MSLRSPLGHARGLGSAKEGTAHWWSQRLTSLALVPLTLWFAVSVAVLAGADHGAMVLWIGHPVVAGLLILLVITTFYHSYLGLQVVIEDYVHHEGWKLGLLLLTKSAAILLALTGALSVLLIMFKG